VTVGEPVIASPVLSEGVAVQVTFHAQRSRRHAVWRLYGTVTPSEVGALVGFQLLRPGHRSVNEGGRVVKANNAATSSFSRRMHAHHRGLYRALVRISDGGHVSNHGESILIR
jgi:hypothetical protein